MSSVADTLGVTCTTARASDLDTELVAIPVYEDDDLADLPELDSGTGGEIARARASGEIRGKPYELYTTGVRGWRAPRVLLVGAGRRDQESTYRLRQVAATASATARERHVRRIGFLSRSQLDVAAAAQAVAEGVVLGAFEDRRYKTDPAHDEGLVACDVAVPESSGVVARPAVERGQVLAYASNLARTLANEPGNVLTPRVFAERADTILAASGVSVDVLEEGRIAALKMGLLLGVARGSAEPPRLILMRYDPPGAPPAPVLGLVGKGVTFDSGGISLKPAEAMERMKEDMAGGAAVMCALHAISALKPAVRVIGVVPATENMPGGKAIKPGDILTSASGKTIEVINTDAEGRLILADALWYAQQLGATHLVDAATLTGSCVVALGKVASGLLGRPESWVDTVRRIADRAGDRVWPLPLFEEYRDQLRSEMADLINSGGRPAGACTAAMFLREFVGDVPWAHLDIAGTAWSDDVKPYQPKGATGVAVRTLAELACAVGSWGA